MAPIFINIESGKYIHGQNNLDELTWAVENDRDEVMCGNHICHIEKQSKTEDEHIVYVRVEGLYE